VVTPPPDVALLADDDAFSSEFPDILLLMLLRIDDNQLFI